MPTDEFAVAKLDGEEVDLTPSLSGTQTVRLVFERLKCVEGFKFSQLNF